VSDDLAIEDAVEQLQQLVQLTVSDKIEWRRSPEAGSYVAMSPGGSTAAIDAVPRGGGRTRAYRVRFSRRGESEFTQTIQQRVSGGEPLPGELQRDSLLSYLYQIVLEKAGHQPSPADEFLEDFT
jgi:hypothetical protein